MKSFDEFIAESQQGIKENAQVIQNLAKEFNGFKGNISEVVSRAVEVSFELSATNSVQLLRTYHEWLAAQLS